MKLLLAVLLLFGFTAKGQTNTSTYDKDLAERLGADDYGMKMYVLVILKTGSAKVNDKSVIDSLFAGHMQNINELVTRKKLVVAGPFGKNENGFRGIFILDAKPDEAKTLVDADPAVRSGLLDAELLPWYGSAALSEYLPVHKKIEKTAP